MRIVLDTNVLISALVFGGPASTIVERVKERELQLFVSPFILNEFEEVLIKKFGYSVPSAREARWDVEAISQVVVPQQNIQAIQAKDSDNRILECGLESKAQVLVTGNLRHIRPLGNFQGIEILTPREFLDKYFPSSL